MGEPETIVQRLQRAQRTLLDPLDPSTRGDWWNRVVEDIAQMMGADHAFAFIQTQSATTHSLFRLDDAFVPTFEEYVANTLAELEPGAPVPAPIRAHQVRRQNGEGVYHEQDLVSRADIERSALYHDVYRPHGVGYTTGMSVPLPGGEAAICVAFESSDAEGFQPEASDRLALLLPAFETGLHHFQRLSRERTRLQRTLDAVSEALVWVAPDGTEHYRNAAFRAMLDAEPRSDVLCDAVRALVREVGRSTFFDVQRTGRSRVTMTAEPYLLRITRAPAPHNAGNEWLVSVERESPFPTARALQAQYDLTPRQAEVARRLGRGLSNDAIADELTISPHTVRRHVHAILRALEVDSRATVPYVLLSARAEDTA